MWVVEGGREVGKDGGREVGRVSVDGKHLHLKLKLNFNEKLYYSTSLFFSPTQERRITAGSTSAYYSSSSSCNL